MDERAAIQWLIFTKELAFIVVNAPDFDHAIHLRKPIHTLSLEVPLWQLDLYPASCNEGECRMECCACHRSMMSSTSTPYKDSGA